GTNFEEATQAKIFGPNGHFIAPYSPSGPSPDAECVAAPGGYRVKGKWRYCSGVPYSTHFMGFAPMKGAPQPGGPKTKMVTVVVPRDQYEILDDWHDMFGLRGSGSNSVVIKDAFTPRISSATACSRATPTAPRRASRSTTIRFTAGCSRLSARASSPARRSA